MDNQDNIDQYLARINENLRLNSAELKSFGNQLLDIARTTSSSFASVVIAIEELIRQGLTSDQVVTRLKDALILSRIAGFNVSDSVQELTNAIDAFNKNALSSTETIDKLNAVDTKFAVASKDLAEAISRVGKSAESAGVGIDELFIISATQKQIDFWDRETIRIESIPIDTLLHEIARETGVSFNVVAKGAERLTKLGVTRKRFLIQRLKVSIECAQEIGLI